MIQSCGSVGASSSQLRDAGKYIGGLPEAEQRQQHWHKAAAILMMTAERSGIVMLAEIAMRKALAHGRPR